MDELYSIQHTLKLVPDMYTEISYADGRTLISAIFEKIKISTNELEASCRKWGMKVNPAKCKIISADVNIIQIDGSIVQKVERFTFLGSVVP